MSQNLFIGHAVFAIISLGAFGAQAVKISVTSIGAMRGLFISALLLSQTMAFGIGFEAIRYEVSIAPNVKERVLAGETKISIKTTVAGVKELQFPVNKLTVDKVTVQGESESFEVESGKLIVKLQKPLNANSAIDAVITYKGRPAPGVNFGANYFYTAFFTCNWIICLEDPYPKATVKMKITVPKNYRTVASGKLIRETDTPNGLKELTWEQERPYSSYLFGIATGEFNEVETRIGSTVLRYLGVKDSPDELKAKFAPTGDMLQFFEEKSGVPYPHEAYTQVLVPGSEAQENSSFSVVGHVELDPIVSNPEEDWVIAHELAHQWWGNLLTCKTWQHFWLNEGITVFMVAAWKEQRWGKAAYDREMQVIRKRYQKAIDGILMFRLHILRNTRR